MSGLVVAALTVVTLLFLTGLFEQLPEATLAAVVIAALIELVDYRSLIAFYRVYSGRLGRIYGFAARTDFIAAMAALLGVLFFDTLPGLFIGIIVSITLLVYRSSRPHVATLGRIPGTSGQYGDIERHPENVVDPSVAILRPESGLYFANADRVKAAILAAAQPPAVRMVVLDLETVPAVDLTASKMLIEVAESLEADGKSIVYTRDVGQVRDALQVGGDVDATVYPSIAAALAAGPAPEAAVAAAEPPP